MKNDYPSNNAQAMDVITFSFLITCAFAYLSFFIFKLLKCSISTFKTRKNILHKDEYELTTTISNEAEDIQQAISQKNNAITELARLKRYLKVISFFAIMSLFSGLYLGIRSINFGIQEQMGK